MTRTTIEFLCRQLRHRYGVLERFLADDLTWDAATRVLGSRPTIAWHTRHVWEEIESTRAAVLASPDRVQVTLGGSVGDAAPDPEAWAELRARTLESATGFLEGLAGLDDRELGAPPLVAVLPAFAETHGTRLPFLEGHLFHVTYHLGAIGLLRAEFRAEYDLL